MSGVRSLSRKLTYFDPAGNPPSIELPEGFLDQALKYFGNQVRSVRRSSGGLVLAEPCQLIVYGEPESEEAARTIRVRVRFRDFRRDSTGRVLTPDYLTQTKTVALRDLQEPFSFRCDSEIDQHFILDFGSGTIPVHVIGYDGDATPLAYFVENDSFETILKSKPGGHCLIQVYMVERNVLRFAHEEDWNRSLETFHKLKRECRRPVPESFRIGEALSVPSGLDKEQLSDFFRDQILGGLQDKTTPGTFLLDEEDGLKPFGIYER